MAPLSTIEVQDLIHKKRVKRMQITRGLSPAELIGRVNARPARAKQVVKEKANQQTQPSA
jgi:hypothetical protein